MGILYSTQKNPPTIEQFYESFYIKFGRDVKKSIDDCAKKIYEKLKSSYPVNDYSLLVCYELAIKQSISYDIDDDITINREITKTLRSLRIDTKKFYEEELRIFTLYPNLCDDIGVENPRNDIGVENPRNDIGPKHPRLAVEVQRENIIGNIEDGIQLRTMRQTNKRLGKKSKGKNRCLKIKNSRRLKINKSKGKNSRRK